MDTEAGIVEIPQALFERLVNHAEKYGDRTANVDKLDEELRLIAYQIIEEAK